MIAADKVLLEVGKRTFGQPRQSADVRPPVYCFPRTHHESGRAIASVGWEAGRGLRVRMALGPCGPIGGSRLITGTEAAMEMILGSIGGL